MFATAGEVVRCEIATFRRNGRSRGFGFVEMADEAQAAAAIEKLHGALAGERKVTVRHSRESQPKPAAPAESNNGKATAPLEPSAEAPAAPQPKTPPTPPRERRPNPPHGQRRQSPPQTHHRPTRPVVSTGEYEFFARGQNTPLQMHPRSRSSVVMETSAYMDDTGDVENRGGRRRGHGRRNRRGGRRHSSHHRHEGPRSS